MLVYGAESMLYVKVSALYSMCLVKVLSAIHGEGTGLPKFIFSLNSG